MSRRHAKLGGFTLIELLFVIAILGVLAGLALTAFRKTRNENDLDRFAVEIRDAITRARRRAVATNSVYIVYVQATSVSYCQRDPATPSQTTCPTAAGALCSSGSGTGPCESSSTIGAGDEATVLQVASFADADSATGPAAVAIGGGKQLYFFPNGSADSDLTTPTPDGFTVYLQGATDTYKHRKVVVYPAAGRPRIIDTW